MKAMTSRIDQAFDTYPRNLFLPPSKSYLADIDTPISIGYGQTNSQPATVKRMLEWLDVKPGAHVLDVGYGSGWTTALLSYLTGEDGTVIAVERVPELVVFGSKNCSKAGVKNATFYQATSSLGWPEHAPYDNILVSASCDTLPTSLLEQLSPPGTLVIPIGHSIWTITKDVRGNLTQTEHKGFSFVPLLVS